MRLILESIQLAITGFWRFLVVLPFLIILIFVVFGGLSLVLWPVAIIVGPTAIVFAQLVAVRTALAAQGIHSSPALGRLVVSSLKYAGFQIAVLAFFLLVTGSALYLLSFTSLRDLDWLADPNVALETATRASPVFLGIVIAYIVFTLWFYASMMVPMAAAAWSASEEHEELDFFWGFGSGLVPLALIIGVSGFVQYKLNSGQLSVDLLRYLVDEAEAKVLHQPRPDVSTELLIEMILAVALNVLVLYWQSVASALALVNRLAARQSANSGHLITPSDQWVDPAALRRARQQQQQAWDDQ